MENLNNDLGEDVHVLFCTTDSHWTQIHKLESESQLRVYYMSDADGKILNITEFSNLELTKHSLPSSLLIKEVKCFQPELLRRGTTVKM